MISRIRTLLVDDAAPLRRLLSLMLERNGAFAVVGEAGNGEEGIALADQLHPDLVLLDLSMPVMDGLEALPRIKTASGHGVVVVLSGFETNRMADQAKALGAAGYVEKGLPPSETVARILAAFQHAPASLLGTLGSGGLDSAGPVQGALKARRGGAGAFPLNAA